MTTLTNPRYILGNLGLLRNWKVLAAASSTGSTGSGLPHPNYTRKRGTRSYLYYLPRLTLRRIVSIIACILALFWITRSIIPPTYANIRRFERALPQHNLELFPPEGKNGRYLRFPGYRKGLGWNNVLQEIIVHSFIANLLDRSYVFEDYTWSDVPFPYVINDLNLYPSRIPLNAFISGPSAGGPINDDPLLPRAINKEFWNVVCPPSRRITFSPAADDIPREREGDVTLEWWVNQLSAFKDDNCLQLDENVHVFFLSYFSDSKLLSIWPRLSQSPVLTEFAWSPLVLSAVEHNAQLFNLENSRDSMPKKVSEISFNGSNIIKALVAIHLRRGDFDQHCSLLMNSGLPYQAFNAFPDLLDKFSPPVEGTFTGDISKPFGTLLKDYYFLHCWPTIEQIVFRLRQVRKEHLQHHPSAVLDHVYILTNGKSSFLSTLRDALLSDGWSSVHSTLDMQSSLTAEQFYISTAIDMAIAEKAEVFVGNGFSSLTSNVVLLRMAKGFDLRTNRML